MLLDLVAGHTSVEHQWFQDELHADGPVPGGRPLHLVRPTRRSRRPSQGAPGRAPGSRRPGPRRGYYLKNFYDAQPALNFGYGALRPDEPWRDAVDAPGPRRNRQALRDIMAFWLDRGVAGFRVDMAFSLVKDDAGVRPRRRCCGASCGSGWTSRIPKPSSIPEGTEPRGVAEPGLPRRLLPRHRPGRTAPCSTTAAREPSRAPATGTAGVLRR